VRARGAPKLVGALAVHAVYPALVDVDEEHEVVAEHRQPVQQRHLDDKREQVVDDGVQELVRHLAPGQVRHALQLVVQVQLRGRAQRASAPRWPQRHVGTPLATLRPTQADTQSACSLGAAVRPRAARVSDPLAAFGPRTDGGPQWPAVKFGGTMERAT